jgi:hypothetical protein
MWSSSIYWIFQLTLRGIKYDYKKGGTLIREFVPLAKLAIYNGKFAKLVHQQCKKKIKFVQLAKLFHRQ